MNIRFGPFLFLRQERQLRGPSGVVDLGDRVCDLLLALLAKPGVTVSKSDLMDAVWPGVAVEENTLQVHLSALRKLLGENLIQTVHGRGYKYVGPEPREDLAGAGEVSDRLARNPFKTSIAVLPFAALTEQSKERLLAGGLVEDLIVELARYRHLRVIGNGLSSHFGEGAGSDQEIAKALGVDFLIRGSIRSDDTSLRVVVQLVDAESGELAWGEKFSRLMGDMFAVQDEIVGAVIARLAFNLDEAAEKQRKRDPTTSSTAYVSFLQARSHWRNGEPLQALACAKKAVELDPDYGRAHAYVGHFYAFERYGQWFDLPSRRLDDLAVSELDRAIELDPSDPFILQRAAIGYLMLGRPETALRLGEMAERESAIDSESLFLKGMVTAFFGRKEEGAACLARAVAVEPRLTPGIPSGLAEVLHMLKDYAGSQKVLDAIARPPHYIPVLRAANLARLGRPEEAQALLQTLPAHYDPVLCAQSEANMCALAEDREHWLESFRLAGLAV